MEFENGSCIVSATQQVTQVEVCQYPYYTVMSLHLVNRIAQEF